MNAYTPAFFDAIRPGIVASAETVVPIVADLVKPTSVVDVGCGEGWWAAEFAKRGCDVLGLDGAYARVDLTGIPFKAVDLFGPIPDLGSFDLAVSLEVAEHLPASRADGFVADLCALAPVVLFSAAIPGQGGAHHVNEQPITYWAERFKANGYAVSGALRWMIWDNDQVECWYRQNLLLAAKSTRGFAKLFTGLAAEPYAVVHPFLFDARRR